MPMDQTMILGMFAIVAGLLISLYGLLPRSANALASRMSQLEVNTLDDVKISSAHVGLLIAMAFAVTIDVMKPTTLAFVMPGMSLEYNLWSPINPHATVPVSLIALAAITGTVLGSVLWGCLGDRIGRRASILYAGIGFIATSICGAMPSFTWNLAMCLLMGMCVGGMLPICYTLLAETMPAKYRGALMVLIGADVAGAYVITSWLAAALVPIFSWRILWLIGLPTGLALIALNRWIPESPRFLVATGRDADAHAVMARYGAQIKEIPIPAAALDDHWTELFRGTFLAHTLVIIWIGFGSGLVLFGLNLWMPTNLRQIGFSDADGILRNAALWGLPSTFIVAWLYGAWSSRKTIILLTSVITVALFAFVFLGGSLAGDRLLVALLMVVPICGVSSLSAVVSVYASEIYPTHMRARGGGLAAASTKLGGLVVVALVSSGLATPSTQSIALVGAASMTFASILALIILIETRSRRLEQLAERGSLQTERQ
ncbi:MFS transporter [Hyphomicrobium sp.]|uniref:MFS transporter n=1 Tax=Hyphomicrobium sp. TaxID=82 RepID=UPI0025C6EB5B|nr:MFS transporter [Hyphomicrobium sp.]